MNVNVKNERRTWTWTAAVCFKLTRTLFFGSCIYAGARWAPAISEMIGSSLVGSSVIRLQITDQGVRMSHVTAQQNHYAYSCTEHVPSLVTRKRRQRSGWFCFAARRAGLRRPFPVLLLSVHVTFKPPRRQPPRHRHCPLRPDAGTFPPPSAVGAEGRRPPRSAGACAMADAWIEAVALVALLQRVAQCRETVIEGDRLVHSRRHNLARIGRRLPRGGCRRRNRGDDVVCSCGLRHFELSIQLYREVVKTRLTSRSSTPRS